LIHVELEILEKTQISCGLQADASQTDMLNAANQLNLFNFQPDISVKNVKRTQSRPNIALLEAKG